MKNTILISRIELLDKLVLTALGAFVFGCFCMAVLIGVMR